LKKQSEATKYCRQQENRAITIKIELEITRSCNVWKRIPRRRKP